MAYNLIILSDKILFNGYYTVVKKEELYNMPTNKPPFTFHMAEEYLEKMRYISKAETRSLGNLIEHVCRRYIECYEEEHGIINLKNICK